MIAARIEAAFGTVWWRDAHLHNLMGRKGKGIVLRAADRIRDVGKPETSGRIIAELSFGFWVNMLLPKYDVALWAPLHSCFPELPTTIDLGMLHIRLSAVHELRNRVGHHEPIFRRNLSQDFADCLELIRWLNSAKANWIAPQCDVPRLMRRKP